jgi:hypothetical protein
MPYGKSRQLTGLGADFHERKEANKKNLLAVSPSWNADVTKAVVGWAGGGDLSAEESAALRIQTWFRRRRFHAQEKQALIEAPASETPERQATSVSCALPQLGDIDEDAEVDEDEHAARVYSGASDSEGLEDLETASEDLPPSGSWLIEARTHAHLLANQLYAQEMAAASDQGTTVQAEPTQPLAARRPTIQLPAARRLTIQLPAQQPDPEPEPEPEPEPAASAALGMSDWSTTQVLEWLPTIGLPVESVSTVYTVLQSLGLDGEDFIELRPKMLQKMLEKAGADDPSALSQQLLAARGSATLDSSSSFRAEEDAAVLDYPWTPPAVDYTQSAAGILKALEEAAAARLQALEAAKDRRDAVDAEAAAEAEAVARLKALRAAKAVREAAGADAEAAHAAAKGQETLRGQLSLTQLMALRTTVPLKAPTSVPLERDRSVSQIPSLSSLLDPNSPTSPLWRTQSSDAGAGGAAAAPNRSSRGVTISMPPRVSQSPTLSSLLEASSSPISTRRTQSASPVGAGSRSRHETVPMKVSQFRRERVTNDFLEKLATRQDAFSPRGSMSTFRSRSVTSPSLPPSPRGPGTAGGGIGRALSTDSGGA